MKLTTEHPTISVDELETLTSEHDVRTSPHVGNLNQETNPNYVILALSGVRLEVVDTIMSNDRSGQPLVKVQDGEYIRLSGVGQSKAKKHTPSALTVDGDPAVSLTQVHMEPLRKINPKTKTSSEYFASIGEDKYGKGSVYQAVIQSTSTLLRLASDGIVSSDPTKRKIGMTAKTLGVYGVDDVSNKLSGLMPSLEGMMAAEIVDACLTGEEEVHHIGGKDMTEYTKNQGLMQNVNLLAQSTLELLGCLPPSKIRYVIYNKNGGIKGLNEASRTLGDSLGVPNFSQHDLLPSESVRDDTILNGVTLKA